MGLYSLWLNTGATLEGLLAMESMDMSDVFEAKMALLWKAEVESRKEYVYRITNGG